MRMYRALPPLVCVLLAYRSGRRVGQQEGYTRGLSHALGTLARAGR